jgi:hypothetical protein
VPRAAGHGCGGRGRRAEGETGQPPREQGRGRGRPRLGSCSPVGERASCSPCLDLAVWVRVVPRVSGRLHVAMHDPLGSEDHQRTLE